ncbi:hypothetical protein PM082_013935 [Marasmius tenuissimus]|nr:hypothetical protein PM082_013935 [Marasmius tenuissimus]
MDTPFDYLIRDSDNILKSCYEELFLSFTCADVVERWKDVRFNIAPLVAVVLDEIMEEREICGVRFGQAAQLQVLKIELKPPTIPRAVWGLRPNHLDQFPSEVPLSCLIRSASLRTLSYTGWTQPSELMLYSMSWMNLTHLELTHHGRRAVDEPFGSLDIMDVLSETCSTLQSFTLKDSYLLEEDSGDPGLSIGFITLPHLHTLSMIFCQQTTEYSLATIFNHIVASSLLDLHVEFWIQATPDASFSLPDFLSRSDCHLRRLNVGLREGILRCDHTENHIIECLEAQPGLVDLQVSSSTWFEWSGIESLVSRLTLEGSSEPLCPDLQAIKFSHCLDLKEESVRKLVTLARSRSSLSARNAENSTPGTVLQALHARFPLHTLGPNRTYWEENVFPLFDELTKAGTEFQLIYQRNHYRLTSQKYCEGRRSNDRQCSQEIQRCPSPSLRVSIFVLASHIFLIWRLLSPS